MVYCQMFDVGPVWRFHWHPCSLRSPGTQGQQVGAILRFAGHRVPFEIPQIGPHGVKSAIGTPQVNRRGHVPIKFDL